MIGHYLRRVDPKSSAGSARTKTLVAHFLHDELQTDGVFLLRLIALNGGDTAVAELVDVMWNDFKRKHAMTERSTPTLSRRSRTSTPQSATASVSSRLLA